MLEFLAKGNRKFRRYTCLHNRLSVKTANLHLSYEASILSEAVRHMSKILRPLQPVQSNFHPQMIMTESDEPSLSFLFLRDSQ